MILSLIRSLKDDERGISALEFAFVAPLMIMLLTGIAQVGMAYFIKNHMQDVAYDVTRRFAVGALTETEAENYANSRLQKLGIKVSINVMPPGEAATTDLKSQSLSFASNTSDSTSSTDDNTVTTVIRAKMSDISPFDILGLSDDEIVEVSASMLVE